MSYADDRDNPFDLIGELADGWANSGVVALVCGGRDFDDYDLMLEALDYFGSRFAIIIHILHGDARGADRLAKVYAQDHFIVETGYPADWDHYGRSAGYIRNKQMLDEGNPDCVIAFPGGKGTDNMVLIAMEKGTPVFDARSILKDA